MCLHCKWRPKVVVYLLLQGRICQSYPERSDLASLASRFALRNLSLLLEIGITGGLPSYSQYLCEFRGPQLQSSHLLSKALNTESFSQTIAHF